MDSNSNIENEKSEVRKIMDDCGLYDPISSINMNQSKWETYKCGISRIDVILVLEDVLSCVELVSYLEYDEITVYDHHAIILDLNYKALMGRKRFDCTKPEQRKLSLHNPNKMTKYLEVIQKEIKMEKFMKK